MLLKEVKVKIKNLLLKEKEMKYQFIFLMFTCISANAQEIVGKWITVDDDTGKEKSVVEVYEKEDGKIYGKIVDFLEDGADSDDTCDHCKGDMKGEKLMGFEVLKGFEKKGDKYENGKVTDPEADKTYDSKIWVDEDDASILKVRGYVSFIYRTQEWKRKK